MLKVIEPPLCNVFVGFVKVKRTKMVRSHCFVFLLEHADLKCIDGDVDDGM